MHGGIIEYDTNTSTNSHQLLGVDPAPHAAHHLPASDRFYYAVESTGSRQRAGHLPRCGNGSVVF